jgi:hypothetical protein
VVLEAKRRPIFDDHANRTDLPDNVRPDIPFAHENGLIVATKCLEGLTVA